MIKKFLILKFILLVFLCDIKAQNFKKAKLDSLFTALADNDKGMMSVAITRNDTIIYQRAIGFAVISDLGNVPANIHTRYRIGSITKTFTAAMIFQLIEQGKLSLNDSLAAYFPQIFNAGKITISNLLNHRSGIYNFTNDPGFFQYLTEPKSREEMVAIIAKSKPQFAPDTRFEYSNSNYVLLGYIIEKITGKTYQENLDQRIISKLNLKETYYGSKTDPKKNESYSYKLNEKWQQQPETEMSIPAGAGALVSTPADLNSFITRLFSNKVVTNASLNQMKTVRDGFGMGLIKVPYRLKTAFGHNGGIDGFASSLYYFQQDNLAVSICSNGISYPINDILIAMLDSYFDVPFSIPDFKTIDVKPEELDKYVGVYSSTSLPLKIAVTKNNNVLTAQATGQASFPLNATERDTFVFDQAGIRMVFNPSKNEFILKQSGGNFLFTKDK